MRSIVAAIARQWVLFIAATLLCLLLGAGWAANQTPIYRSTATLQIDGDAIAPAGFIADEAAFAASFAVRDEFIGRTGAAIVPTVRADGEAIQVSMDAQVPAVAQELAAAYADSVLAMRNLSPSPGVPIVLQRAADYPASPHSPNLMRVGLISLAIGLGLGAFVTLARDRLRSSVSSPAPVSVAPPRLDLGPAGWLDAAVSPPAVASSALPRVQAPTPTHLSHHRRTHHRRPGFTPRVVKPGGKPEGRRNP